MANAAEPISSVSQTVTTTENKTEVSFPVEPSGKIIDTIKLGENVTGELYENGVVDIADVQEKGNGINNIDVITIQQYMLKIIDSFDNV